MARIDARIKERKLEEKAHLLLQVHDELIYEIKDDTVETLSIEIKNIMQDVLTPEQNKGVPIIANSSAGPSWGDMD